MYIYDREFFRGLGDNEWQIGLRLGFFFHNFSITIQHIGVVICKHKIATKKVNQRAYKKIARIFRNKFQFSTRILSYVYCQLKLVA